MLYNSNMLALAVEVVFNIVSSFQFTKDRYSSSKRTFKFHFQSKQDEVEL